MNTCSQTTLDVTQHSSQHMSIKISSSYSSLVVEQVRAYSIIVIRKLCVSNMRKISLPGPNSYRIRDIVPDRLPKDRPRDATPAQNFTGDRHQEYQKVSVKEGENALKTVRCTCLVVP